MNLTKHQTVADLVDVTDDTVTFSNHPITPLPEEDRTEGTVILQLAKNHWTDMGMPSQVTVAVEPGDRLNEEG